MITTDLQTIGPIVELTIRGSGIKSLPAKVDTGADVSSIWASSIKEVDGHLSFSLLGPSSPRYSGEVLTIKDYKKVRIQNSFGQKEVRYSVLLKVEIDGRIVNARFSLANRELKSYPALIGRRLLNKRFLVNVSLKQPVRAI